MGTQQLCLKWNKHYSNLLDISERLLSTEALVDVTLACEGFSLKAHKLVLSACSPFFQAIFTENPCKHPVVIMKGVSYADLKAIIEFMYRGEVSVTRDQLSALLETAQMLQVRGLAEDNDDDVQNSEPSAPMNTSSSNAAASAAVNKQQESASHKRRKRKRRRPSSGSDGNYSDSENQSSLKVEEPASPEVVSIDDKETVAEQDHTPSPVPEQRLTASGPSTRSASQQAPTSGPSTRSTSQPASTSGPTTRSASQQASSLEPQSSTLVPVEALQPEVQVEEIPPSLEKQTDIKVEPVEVLDECMETVNTQDVSESLSRCVETVLQQLPPSFTLTPVLSESQTLHEPHPTRTLSEQTTHVRKSSDATAHHSRTLPEPLSHHRKTSESHHSFHPRSVPEPHSVRTMPEPDMSVLVPFSISSESSAGSLHDNTSQDVMLINNVPFEEASSSSLVGPSHQQDGAEGSSSMMYSDSSGMPALPGPSGYQPDEQSSRSAQGSGQGYPGVHSEGTAGCHMAPPHFLAPQSHRKQIVGVGTMVRRTNNKPHLNKSGAAPPAKRYPCDVCSSTFSWRNNMYAHRKRAHPEFMRRRYFSLS